MDIFDRFFKKFAYKFDKGYPDMNNAQDVLLLESLFEKLNIEVELKEDKISNKANSIKAVKQIIDQVGSKYNLFAMKSKPNRIGSKGNPREYQDYILLECNSASSMDNGSGELSVCAKKYIEEVRKVIVNKANKISK